MNSSTEVADSAGSSLVSSRDLMDWMLAHRKKLMAGMGLMVVAFAVQALMQSSQKQKISQANQALYQAKALASGTTEARAALEKVSRDYAKTRASWEALMILGDLDAAKDAKTASAWYEKAQLEATDPRDQLLARYALAFSREREGNFEQAVASLESAQRLGLPLLKGELALARARMLERQGKKEEAAKAFDAVARDFAGSETGKAAEGWKSAQ